MCESSNTTLSSTTPQISDIEICLVCCRPLSDPALTSTCRHQFCFECLNEWSTEHYQCPLCRRIYGYMICESHDPKQIEYIPIGYCGPIMVPKEERDLLEEAEDRYQAISHTLARLKHRNPINKSEAKKTVKSIEMLEKLEIESKALLKKRQKQKERALRRSKREDNRRIISDINEQTTTTGHRRGRSRSRNRE